MKKYILPLLASFLIVTGASAFKPATLFIETWNGLKRVAVYSQEQAENLFKQGYRLDQGQMLGATITTINGSDTLKDSRTTINDNFTSLNSYKIENSTTSVASITTLSNLVTVGTITSGTWNGTAIGVAKGGTGTTSPSIYQVILGNGASGLTVASGTGSSGQFLTSGGAGAYPTWTTSSINQASNYTWTGTHTFATTTQATSTITQLTVGSTTQSVFNPAAYNTLTTSVNADGLHTHNYSDLIYSTASSSALNTTGWVALMTTTTIPANTMGTGNVLKAKINISDYDAGGSTIYDFTAKYGNTGGVTTRITNSQAWVNQGGYILVDVVANGASSQIITITANVATSSTAVGAMSTDSTAAQPFVVIVKSNDGSNNLTPYGGYVEIIK